MWFAHKLDLNEQYIPLEVVLIDCQATIGYSYIYGLLNVGRVSDADLYETKEECIDYCNWMNKKKKHVNK